MRLLVSIATCNWQAHFKKWMKKEGERGREGEREGERKRIS